MKQSTRLNQQEMVKIESVLQTTLFPVTPRQQFVQDLRQRLMNTSFPSQIANRLSYPQGWLIVVFFFVGATVMVSIGLRFIIGLLVGLSLIQMSRQELPETQTDMAVN